MKYEVVLDGVPLAEGPVWCPDGTLVITHLSPGGLRRIQPERGTSEIIASMPGGANSAQLASDGGFIVAQNGGIDFSPYAEQLNLDPSLLAYTPGTPGLQRVRPSGQVEYLLDSGLSAPNDLVADHSALVDRRLENRLGVAHGQVLVDQVLLNRLRKLEQSQVVGHG